MTVYFFDGSEIALLNPARCSSASATLSLLGNYELSLTVNYKLSIGAQIIANIDGSYYEFIVATSAEQWNGDVFVGQYSCVPSFVWEFSKTPLDPGYIGSWDGATAANIATAIYAAIPDSSRWARTAASDITTTGNILYNDYTTSWELLKRIASVYNVGYMPVVSFSAVSGTVTARTLRAFNAAPTTFTSTTVFNNSSNVKELRVSTQGSDVVAKISGLGAVISTDETTGVKKRANTNTSYTNTAYTLPKTDGTLWYPEARPVKNDTAVVSTLQTWLQQQRNAYFIPREEVVLRITSAYKNLRIGDGASVTGFAAPTISGGTNTNTYTGMISRLKYDLLHEDALIEVTVGSEYKYSI